MEREGEDSEIDILFLALVPKFDARRKRFQGLSQKFSGFWYEQDLEFHIIIKYNKGIRSDLASGELPSILMPITS